MHSSIESAQYIALHLSIFNYEGRSIYDLNLGLVPAINHGRSQARNHGGTFRGRAPPLNVSAPRWVFLVTYKILIIFTASTAASDSMNFGERYMLRSDKANMFHYRLFKRTISCVATAT